jgi:hypothetical protein
MTNVIILPRILLMGLVFVFVSSAASLAGHKIIGTAPVEQDWFEGQIRWTEGPPSYKFRWHVRVNKQGIVILCGAGRWVSANLRSESKRVIRDRAFFFDDMVYYKDMSFFATVKSDKLIGAPANCVSTGKQPPKQVKDGVGILPLNPNKVY